MCTVVVSLEPGERVPLRLLGIRDEFTGRPWRPPARHWPGSPLIGGIDEQAGGTWLAVHPGIPRVACLLNGRGPLADPARRRSRGDLSLRAAAEGHDFLRRLAGDPDALAAYDPFHLICGTPDAVTMVSYPPGGRPPVPPDVRAAGPDRKDRDRIRPVHADDPGRAPVVVVRELGPGTHLITNAGHAYPAEPGDPAGEPKAAHFADKFGAARPPASPALPVSQAWGDWLTLAAGDGLDPADPAGIIVRHRLPDGRVHGSTSVTLVALADDAVRYDFQPHPGSADGWYPVPLSG
ncbi:MAG TPA: NRDE family protein [Trebonia sp.]